jgi:aerobic carbon-monoxide dehydrogenase large subunit
MTRWVGAAVPRKEDRRMLLGRGRFVADLSRPGLLHAAFARSPHAHARINGIDVTAAREGAGVHAVFTAAGLGHPRLLATLERPEFTVTPMPVLAGGTDKVRFVGEPVAVVIAEDPYLAEDAAELVDVDWDPLPPVTGITSAGEGTAPRLHEEAGGNCLVDLMMFDADGLEAIFETAHTTVSATFESARVAALPLEGRACLAEWDDRDDQLVLNVSTQVPHQVRSAVAQALHVPERAVRVIAPDVGGGFGLKCVVGREEVAVAAAALRLRRPVRWAEDRQENLTAAFHGHEQRYQVRAAFDADGRIRALDAEIDCDTGAYSAFPFTCAVEPLMAATELPGVYKVPAYRARGRAFATNKAPTAPYRGVSRPQIVLVMERLMEKAAAALNLDPLEVRRRNLIGKDEFPYLGVNGITYDEGSYRESLDLAEQKTKNWLEERERLRETGRRAGIGFACFSERTAYGTPAMSQRRMGMTPGYDTAMVRMDPTGEVIVTTGTCGHGQGHETTFAQIVADRLGVHPDQVRLRQGDTDLACYGWGTWGSRSVVIGGGAAGRAADAVADQLRKIAAGLLEASPADVELAGGRARIRGDDTMAVDMKEIAALAYFQAHRLAEDLRYGLEARASFDPPGTFSNACHVAMVVIDPGTCGIRLHRYLVVEDCGVVINPVVVDGQVRGGVTQGAAAALLERVCFDPGGQPVTTTLMDYLAPTAAEMCQVEIAHLETPSRFSETGAKGMGEGGTIGAPAAVLNAINDALSDTDVRFDRIPVLPQDLSAAVHQAGAAT